MKDAYYFPHDSNAREDPKLAALRQEFGFEGIGIWWTIIELMHAQKDGRFEKFPAFYTGMGAVLGLDEAKVKHFFSASISRFHLFKEDEKFIWSERVQSNLRERLEKRMKKVDAGRLGGISSGIQRSKTKQCLKQTNQSKVKESKVNKRISIGSAIPETNKPLSDIQKIVTAFKMLQGYSKDDQAWDKLNFARFSAPAKKLLEFIGNWRDSVDCAQEIYEKLTSKGMTVTLETITKHAAEWKKDKLEKGELNGVFHLQSDGNSQTKS